MLQHADREALGFLPYHLVLQEQDGVDISVYKTSPSRGWRRDAHLAAQISMVEAITIHLPKLESLIIDLGGSMASFSPWLNCQKVSDYLTSKIEKGELRNICARVCRGSPEFTFHYWSRLDDTAVDFLKTTTNGAHVLDVFITGLPGGQLPPAVFDILSRGCIFYTNLKIGGLEGLVLEKCGELGILSEGEVEEKEIFTANAILNMMPRGGCGLHMATMPKVFR